MRAPSRAKGATRGKVYRAIAQLRLEDAACLFENSRLNGAIYLAGYAIECYLKYVYCVRKSALYLPARLEIHDWEALVLAGGLQAEVYGRREMAGVFAGLVQSWTPSLRYRPATIGSSTGTRLYNGIREFYNFLQEIVP